MIQHDDINHITIFAEAAETEVVESAQPSLQQAYAEGHDSNDGDSKKRERAPRDAMPSADTLAEAESTSREWTESEKQRLAAKPKKEVTLSQAYSGEEPEDADVLLEQDGIPEALQRFSPAAIGRAMDALGLTFDDLADPRWLPVVAAQLEADGEYGDDSDGDESGEDGEDGEEEESAEDDPEAQSDEKKEPEAEKKAEVPAYLLPTDAEFGKLVEARWTESQDPRFNDPRAHTEFASSLAAVLAEPVSSEEERYAQVDKVTKLAEYGIHSAVTTALPHLLPQYVFPMIQSWIDRNFAFAMESFAPGFSQSYSETTLSKAWEEVRGSDLPPYSTDADSEFQQLAAQVQKNHPELASWQPTRPDGKPMPFREALRAKALVTAKMLRGERVSSQTLRQTITEAMETGKKSAEKSARRVSASRALGKGRTTGGIGKEESTTSLRDAYRAQHGNGEEID